MNKKIISVITVCALALCTVSCGKKETKPVLAATNVTVTVAKNKSIEKTINYTGEVKATSISSVSAKVSGNIRTINAEIGDYVKAGTVLMTIDSTQYAQAYNQANAAYNQALANIEVANAAREQAVASKKSAEAAVENTQAAKDGAQSSYESVTEGSINQSKINMNQNVINAETAYKNAEDNYNRQKQLYDIGAISKVALDSAKTNLDTAKLAYDTAKANAELNDSVLLPQTEAGAKTGVNQAQAGVNQAQAGVEAAQAGIKQADAGIVQAEAGVKQAKVNLDIASTNLANCTVVAPISGYITSKNASIGQLASPGVEIFSIKNSDMVDVEINVTEAVISSISENTKANISIKSASLDNIKGYVSVVSKAKNEATGMFMIKVAIPNEDGKIKIGMLADVSLVTEKTEDVLAVDSSAIINKNGKNYVYIAQGDKAVKKEIEIGITDGKNTEILKGIKKGDKVITDGKDFLSDKNNKIRIVK